MKRIQKTVYKSDSGKTIVTLRSDGNVYGTTVGELEELASACAAAAEELRDRDLEEAAEAGH